MSGDLGARGWGTGDDDDTAMQEQQQHAGWRNTYIEQPRHAGDTCRARRGERCALGIGQALQRGGIHPGVREVVDVERVADRDTGAHDGHAVRRDIVRLQ